MSIRRDRRSLRKRTTKQLLAEFNTEIVKKDSNPNFGGETFATEIAMADYKV